MVPGRPLEFDDARVEGDAARVRGQSPHPAVAAAGLELHHLPVDDMTPPSAAQVRAFAEILDAAERDGRGLVVHCLAGIGRTTTMIVAGHLLRGHPLPRLRREVEPVADDAG